VHRIAGLAVRGTAAVTIGQEERHRTRERLDLHSLGAVHRLANPGRIPLELIEVQTGSHLGEDDIVRLQDVYGRRDGGAVMTRPAFGIRNGCGLPVATGARL
jgi:mannose-1-phosphate guanylyltransferase/mannose-6-phosphate isomerase